MQNIPEPNSFVMNIGAINGGKCQEFVIFRLDGPAYQFWAECGFVAVLRVSVIIGLVAHARSGHPLADRLRFRSS
jgi:hypothetical protein